METSQLPIRHEIIRLAKQERDRRTPYIYGGQTLGGAVDCSGLVIAIWQHLRLVPSNYDASAHTLYHEYPAIRLDQLEGGDLVFFARPSFAEKYPGYKVPHVAIYTGRDQRKQRYIIHAAGGDEKCTSPAIAFLKRAYVKQQPLFIRRDLCGCASIDRLLTG